jgi:hypothetical protein
MTADVKTRIARAVIGLAVTAALAGALLWWRPSGLYLWGKAVHVIAIIAWMAGMLYLPRLFIYHCEAEPGSRQSETFKVMERRLLTIIINPAMVVSWALGLTTVAGSGPGGFMPSLRWCWRSPACTASWCAGCAISAPSRTAIRRDSIVLSMKYRQP